MLNKTAMRVGAPALPKRAPIVVRAAREMWYPGKCGGLATQLFRAVVQAMGQSP